MWNLFYRNTRLLILTLCLIVVWGCSSYLTMPRLEDPILTQRLALVTTLFPGAGATRVESLVTEKVERELFEIKEIEKIDSTSRPGISTVLVELRDDVTNVNEVWSRVRDQLADLPSQLPEGAQDPDYDELEARAYAMIVGLTWDLDSPPSYAILRRTTEELGDQLRFIHGTEQVDLVGDPDEEIVVEASPANLSALNLTIQGLSQQIRSSDAKVPAGRLRNPSNEVLIEPETELDSLESVRQIPIRFGHSGQSARLGDIARVQKGIAEPPSSLAVLGGRPAIALAVFVNPNQRIDHWADAARDTIQSFQDSLPRGISVQIIFDQSRYIEERLNGLFMTLLLAALFVVASALFMMGWRSALIVGTSLPISVLLVFGVMNAMGIPLHQMSVIGLVMALGLLIDNAIVVVDELQHQLDQGIKPRVAVTKAAKYLAVPLLASTLTTVFTFMPNALMTGNVGEFIRTVGISVILSLSSSLFVSLTIVPALYAKLYRVKNRLNNGHHASRLQNLWTDGYSNPQWSQIYQRMLDRILSRPLRGVVLCLIIPLFGFLMVTSLEQQFFPPAERDQFHIEFELQPQISLEQTQALVMKARDIILDYPHVTSVYWFIGENAPSFYYNFPQARTNTANYAQALVQLDSVAKDPSIFREMQQKLTQAFPSSQILVRQLEQGPIVGAPIQIRLYGPNLDVLKDLGDQARAELAQVTNVTQHRASLTNTLPKLGLSIDEDQARLAGLDNTAIAQQINAAVEGSVGGSILEGTEELPIRVRLPNELRSDLDQIASLEISSSNSPSDQNPGDVPLSAVSRIDLVPELAAIPRYNGRRANTVEAFIEAGALPSTVLSDFQDRLESSNFQPPPGYSYEFEGEMAERNQAVVNLFSTLPFFLVLMICSLVLSFGSFQLAGIIVLVAVCSIGLGFASLWIFGYPLGFMAILGTAGLVGLAINDSIVVLAALRSDPQARHGKPYGIRQVVVRSTRHVLTTTITTIAGFIPLLAAGGSFWPPLAIAIVGGVGGCTLLALTLVPCIYLILTSRNTRLSAKNNPS
ncbi:MAG: efflux RND transporter permease subunit [Elainellaceae cyanobacterium]